MDMLKSLTRNQLQSCTAAYIYQILTQRKLKPILNKKNIPVYCIDLD